MLTREHLRLKIFQTLYAYYQAENRDLAQAEKDLELAIDRVYDVYILYLLMIEQLLFYTKKRIEKGRNKKLPRPEDLQPNLKFITNPLLIQLSYNPSLAFIAKKRKLELSSEHMLLQSLYQSFVQSQIYNLYMSEPVGTYEEEKRSLIRIIKSVIINHKPFHRWLEKHSIHIQMDDIDRICSILLKTLKGFKESGENLIYPAYKIEYRDFFIPLLRKTVIHSAWIEELLKAKSENWDIERFAVLDILLLKMAVTEALEFPSIPAKVTMNEYIEFAKNYSTDKSGSFVNGLLEKVLQELELQGKIKKMPVKEIQIQEEPLKIEPLAEEKPKRKARIKVKEEDK